jgi:polyferredoxin
MEREKSLETSLVLASGFILVFIITKIELFVYFAFALGIIGIFFKPIAKIIAIGWFKLAEILNYFVSKLIFGTLYFVVLVPISVLYRFFNKDSLKLKNSSKSLWHKRDHFYSAIDLENIW